MQVTYTPSLPDVTTHPHACAAELRRCSALRELNLEGNKLTTPVLDLRALYNLQSLQVRGGGEKLLGSRMTKAGGPPPCICK